MFYSLLYKSTLTYFHFSITLTWVINFYTINRTNFWKNQLITIHNSKGHIIRENHCFAEMCSSHRPPPSKYSQITFSIQNLYLVNHKDFHILTLKCTIPLRLFKGNKSCLGSTIYLVRYKWRKVTARCHVQRQNAEKVMIISKHLD